jgi:hypothetical protein
VNDTTVKPVAAVVPKVTFVAPMKPVPAMVTRLPPAVLPCAGDTPDTSGRIAAADRDADTSSRPPTAIEATIAIRRQVRDGLRETAACLNIQARPPNEAFYISNRVKSLALILSNPDEGFVQVLRAPAVNVPRRVCIIA